METISAADLDAIKQTGAKITPKTPLRASARPDPVVKAAPAPKMPDPAPAAAELKEITERVELTLNAMLETQNETNNKLGIMATILNKIFGKPTVRPTYVFEIIRDRQGMLEQVVARPVKSRQPQ